MAHPLVAVAARDDLPARPIPGDSVEIDVVALEARSDDEVVANPALLLIGEARSGLDPRGMADLHRLERRGNSSRAGRTWDGLALRAERRPGPSTVDRLRPLVLLGDRQAAGALEYCRYLNREGSTDREDGCATE